jgi:hypothetical protein
LYQLVDPLEIEGLIIKKRKQILKHILKVTKAASWYDFSKYSTDDSGSIQICTNGIIRLFPAILKP